MQEMYHFVVSQGAQESAKQYRLLQLSLVTSLKVERRHYSWQHHTFQIQSMEASSYKQPKTLLSEHKLLKELKVLWKLPQMKNKVYSYELYSLELHQWQVGWDISGDTKVA